MPRISRSTGERFPPQGIRLGDFNINLGLDADVIAIPPVSMAVARVMPNFQAISVPVLVAFSGQTNIGVNLLMLDMIANAVAVDSAFVEPVNSGINKSLPNLLGLAVNLT